MSKLAGVGLALVALAWIAASAFVADRLATRAEAVLTATATGRSEWPAVVEIPRGQPASAIIAKLAEERLVDDPRVLRAWLRVSGLTHRIQAGEYAFERPMSVIEVAEVLASGKVMLHAVTVPEGLALDETAARLAASGLWSEADLLAAFSDPAPIRDLVPGAEDLEGYLFPDTYRFARGEPASAVARAMVGRFRAAWEEAGGSQRAGEGSVRRIATLASLVEKETALAEEHALVASVYANRLRLGMRMEADPTVITAMKKAGAWTGGPLLIRDLSFASPWNTYVNAGLPPGPICSFGKAALLAALEPAQTEFLFFVATGDGGHRFAKTLREHERNVRDYRAHQRAERAAARSAQGAAGAQAGQGR